MYIIQNPNKIKSRPVTDEHIPLIVSLKDEMVQLCHEPIGEYKNGGFALSHVQVDDKNPLRFYVMSNGQVIINPEITDHTKHQIFRKEGCLSFPYAEPRIVQRWNVITLEYQTLILEPVNSPEDYDNPRYSLSQLRRVRLTSKYAIIAQHEIDHMNGITIFS